MESAISDATSAGVDAKKNGKNKKKDRTEQSDPQDEQQDQENWRVEEEDCPFDWFGDYTRQQSGAAKKSGENSGSNSNSADKDNSSSDEDDGDGDGYGENAGADGFTTVDRRKKKATFKIMTTKVKNIQALSSVRVTMPTHGGLRSSQRRSAIGKNLNEVVRRFGYPSTTRHPLRGLQPFGRHQGGVPLLNPIKDMKIGDGVVRVVQKIREVRAEIASHPLRRLIYGVSSADKSPPGGQLRKARRLWLIEALRCFKNRVTLRNLLGDIRAKSAKSRRLVLRREIKSMGDVLIKLGLVEVPDAKEKKSRKKEKKLSDRDSKNSKNSKNSDSSSLGNNAIVTLKGMTAVELNQEGSELVACEMLLSGAFVSMPPEIIVSVMSCFTFDESLEGAGGGGGAAGGPSPDPAADAGLPPFLADAYRVLTDCARIVGKASIECGVYSLTPGASKGENDELSGPSPHQNAPPDASASASAKNALAATLAAPRDSKVTPDDFANNFNPGLMRATYAWAKGAKFVEVQKLTDTFEGQTIRCLRRLEELVRQLGAAAQAIGNQELKDKFEKGSELLRRDIVFCSSLYL